MRHAATWTAIKVISSKARTAFGIGAGCRLVVADEPASWEERGGELMRDAIETSLGKSDMQVVYLGTLPPARDGSWWPAMVAAGSTPQRHVTALQGDEKTWDRWQTIASCNPLVRLNPTLRARLRAERDVARLDDDAKARFLAYRLNLLSGGHRNHLVTVADWRRVEARPVADRAGAPIVGVDIGAGWSWSAAWALWPNGRSEVVAVTPGEPELAEQARRAGLPRGLLEGLEADGVLVVDAGRRMARIEVLVDAVAPLRPRVMVGDRFHAAALADAVRGRWPVIDRINRWSSASEDIAAFRRAVTDGALSIDEASRPLARLSLAHAETEADTAGNVRMLKAHRRRRDDVAVAGVMAVGLLARLPARWPVAVRVANPA